MKDERQKWSDRIRGWVKASTEGVVFLIDNVERLAIVIVSRAAPWAAPLAPAYLVATAVQKHFDTPLWVAVAVGVTLEAVGIASTHITMEMYQYNQTKRQSDPKAPFDVGLAATIVYFLVGISLTVVLEIFPETVIIAPAAFFLLAIVAYITLALMSGHARRTQGIEQEKQDKKKRHQSGTRTATRTGTWTAIGTATRDQARAIMAERPAISGSELGRQLGRSERLGRRLKTELEAEQSSNGKEPAMEPVEERGM
jgi:hypothetical protein